jgi:hypothetical protein
VAAEEFFFAIEVPVPPAREMIDELTLQVVRRIGCDDKGTPALLDAVRSALAAAARASQLPCELRFRAHDRRLHIAVSSPAGEVWQTSREIN